LELSEDVEMKIGGRMLNRLNSIERKYGDVALAATMFSLAIAVHGAFAVASLQKHAEPADSASNVAAELDPSVAPIDLDDVGSPIPTFTSHAISFASVPELPAASTTTSVATTAPAESIPATRQNAPAQLKPATNTRLHDTKTVTTEQLGESSGEPPGSAPAADQGSRVAPLGISALSDPALSDQPESTISTQPTISAVSR